MARSESRRSLLRGAGRRRLVLGFAVAVALPFGVACNSLIGLSDFEKGQCAGARCPDEGGLVDQLVIDGGETDAPKDAPLDVKGADPVSWAQWRMPNYGEGGAGLPPTSPPLDADGGVVTDPTTGLVWRSTLLVGKFTAPEAEAACRKVPDGPWRAPKRIELVTLLDYSGSVAFIDLTRLGSVGSDTVVTTSEVRPFVPTDPGRAYWAVDFGAGTVKPSPVAFALSVLCVRAAK